jgi:hypothetical protein
MDPERHEPDDPLDLLIGRAVGLEADGDDWRDLERAAARDPDLWRRLALSLKGEGMLVRAVDRAVEPVARVASPLPLPRAAPRAARPRLAMIASAASGWLAAAVLAVCWMAGAHHGSDRPEPGAMPSSPVVDLRGDDPIVVGELPMVMVDSRPAAGGRGFDVLCVKRTLQRVRVDSVSGIGADENGNPRAIPIDPTQLMNLEEL